LWRDWVTTNPDQMQSELDQAQTTLDGTIEEVRRSIYAMRPLALDEAGLLAALRQHIADFEDHHHLMVDLQLDLAEAELPRSLELPLFRVVQESLNNVAQHANASQAAVRLEIVDKERIKLTIRDNGQGFDVAILDRIGRTGHLGLKQMRERIEKAGGEFQVLSSPGEGTEIRVVMAS
jgi:signal transduction histidine kinase